MAEFLSNINSVEDLRNISIKDLPQVAEELRELIIDRVSRNGGHLSSNLGVIELTIALHYALNTPNDKVVWDVGHQCYPHKILTGRRDQFHTLRQDGGISGFPRREESQFDVSNTGHSGTSISMALALAQARDSKKEERSVVAVIGDGSMTSGLALEGLNNAGALNTNLIVVLNDNMMSISPNVGALSAHLNRMITGQLYNKMKTETETLMKSIPGIGAQVAKFAHRIEEGVKNIIIPGRLFEDLGFKYVGPIEGHNIELLIDTFKSVQKLNGPILLHVVTTKGKGYSFAEEKPDNYHGTPQFDIESGDFNKKVSHPTFTSTFGEAIVKLAEKDDRIVAITAAMADGTGLDKFSKQFPDRFFDAGIAEQHAVTFASGLASEGFRPIVPIYSTFLQRGYDQIVQDVCMMNHPVTFVMDRAGIVGEDGPTHQGLFDISFMRNIPNMTFMAPKDEGELGPMLKTAISIGGPVAIRYPRGPGFGATLQDDFEILPVGKAEIVRDGSNCVILAIGNSVHPSIEAAKSLEDEGISVSVVNMRFIKPLDLSIIEKCVKKFDYILTVEENILQGGFGSAVLEAIDDLSLRSPKMKRVGIPDCFVEHASPGILRERYGLDAAGIAVAVRKLVPPIVQTTALFKKEKEKEKV